MIPKGKAHHADESRHGGDVVKGVLPHFYVSSKKIL